MNSNRRRFGRLQVVGAVAGATVLLAAGPAFAHVTVQPGQAEKGGYSTVAFKVPNERDDARDVQPTRERADVHPIVLVERSPEISARKQGRTPPPATRGRWSG